MQGHFLFLVLSITTLFGEKNLSSNSYENIQKRQFFNHWGSSGARTNPYQRNYYQGGSNSLNRMNSNYYNNRAYYDQNYQNQARFNQHVQNTNQYPQLRGNHLNNYQPSRWNVNNRNSNQFSYWNNKQNSRNKQYWNRNNFMSIQSPRWNQNQIFSNNIRGWNRNRQNKNQFQGSYKSQRYPIQRQQWNNNYQNSLQTPRQNRNQQNLRYNNNYHSNYNSPYGRCQKGALQDKYPFYTILNKKYPDILGQCIEWADGRYFQLTGVHANFQMNATYWEAEALRFPYKWKVSTQPSVPSIMVMTNKAYGFNPIHGHVAVVESVYGNQICTSNWNYPYRHETTYVTFTTGPGIYFLTHRRRYLN